MRDADPGTEAMARAGKGTEAETESGRLAAGRLDLRARKVRQRRLVLDGEGAAGHSPHVMPLLAAWSIAGLLRLLEGHRKFVCSKDTASSSARSTPPSRHAAPSLAILQPNRSTLMKTDDAKRRGRDHDPAVAQLDGDFVSGTATANGTTMHYV